MADFRRWFFAFAVVALVLGMTIPASAQTNNITCGTTTAVPSYLRHEGLTELVGDIVLQCSGVPGATPIPAGGGNLPQVNISVSLGATVSTSTSGSNGGLDALLLVDDPTVGNTWVCQTPTNGLNCQDAADGGAPFTTATRYNVFQGVAGPGPNTITFYGVPVDVPATSQITYRITNIRVQGPSVPAGAFGVTPVYAYITSSNTGEMSIPTTQAIVGNVATSLSVSGTTTASTFFQCLNYGTTPVGSISFTELFAPAFKLQCNPSDSGTGTNSSGTYSYCAQTTPGAVYNSESGLAVSLSNMGTAGPWSGQATSATELEAVISDVPAGVSIYVDSGPVCDANGTGTCATLISPTPSGSPTLVLANPAGAAPASVTVVYAITSENASAIAGPISANIYTSFTGAPGTSSPTANVTAYSQGGYSPQESAWVNGGPIPEFTVGLTPAAPGQSLFVVSLCQTILLFPYVTDFYGFDTGIAISNTSLDGLGPAGASSASSQTGGCSVAFYDNGGLSTNIGTSGMTPGYINSNVSYNGVATISSDGSIAPGQTWAFSLCNSDTTCNTVAGSGSSGYAIATCDFQFAHGYSFVSDVGIRNFAAAYLALVIPDAPRAAQPNVCATLPVGYCMGEAGEQLVH